MSLGNMPGSLGLQTRVSGTLRGRNIGTLPQSKISTGTLRQAFSGGGYGSFGTHMSHSLVARAGSISGTVWASGVRAWAWPGTWRARTSGTFPPHGGSFAPPARARYVNVVVRRTTTSGSFFLRQRGQGTLDLVSAGLGDYTLSAWVLPNHGTYNLGTVVNPNSGDGPRVWKEWDP